MRPRPFTSLRVSLYIYEMMYKMVIIEDFVGLIRSSNEILAQSSPGLRFVINAVITIIRVSCIILILTLVYPLKLSFPFVFLLVITLVITLVSCQR